MRGLNKKAAPLNEFIRQQKKGGVKAGLIRGKVFGSAEKEPRLAGDSLV